MDNALSELSFPIVETFTFNLDQMILIKGEPLCENTNKSFEFDSEK